MATDANDLEDLDAILASIPNLSRTDKLRLLQALGRDLLEKMSRDELPIEAKDGSTLGFLVAATPEQREESERRLIAELDRRMSNPGKLSTPQEVLARLQSLGN